MNLFKYFFTPLPIALAMVSGCAPNTDTKSTLADVPVLETEYLRVKHHPVECEGFHIDHCLLTQKDTDDRWVRFYDRIEGFTYHWGVDYEIVVEVQKIDAQLQDQSDRYYSLLEILSETKQETFTYTSLEAHQRILEVGPNYFSLLGKKDFTCTTNSCADIRSVIEQQHNALLLFRPETDPNKPLILDAVLCSDSAVSFDESCSQIDI